jgi:hypothetical protein
MRKPVQPEFREMFRDISFAFDRELFRTNSKYRTILEALIKSESFRERVTHQKGAQELERLIKKHKRNLTRLFLREAMKRTDHKLNDHIRIILTQHPATPITQIATILKERGVATTTQAITKIRARMREKFPDAFIDLRSIVINRRPPRSAVPFEIAKDGSFQPVSRRQKVMKFIYEHPRTLPTRLVVLLKKQGITVDVAYVQRRRAEVKKDFPQRITDLQGKGKREKKSPVLDETGEPITLQRQIWKFVLEHPTMQPKLIAEHFQAQGKQVSGKYARTVRSRVSKAHPGKIPTLQGTYPGSAAALQKGRERLAKKRRLK